MSRRISDHALAEFQAKHPPMLGGDPATATQDALMPRVRELNGQIAQAREQAGQAWTSFDRLRADLAGSDRATDPESPEFKAAEDASKAYTEAADTLQAYSEARDRLLAMTTEGGRHGAPNGPQDGDRNAGGGGTVADALGRRAMSAGDIALNSADYKRLASQRAFTQTGRKSIEAVLIGSGEDHSPEWEAHREELRHALKGGGGGMSATLVTGAGATSGGALITPDRLPGITVPMMFRPLRLLDLITVGQTDGDTVEYVEMTGFTNNAAETAEATATGDTSGTKPESALALAERTQNVRTIAHWIPATKRALADAGQLRTLIDQILRLGLDLRLDGQIVNGNGAGENLRGIRNTVGIGSVNRVEAATGNTLVPETILDAIHRAITVVRLAFFEPTAVGIHPTDWEIIRLARAGKQPVANQAGTAGSYAEGDYLMGDPTTAGTERIWGLLPVISAAFTVGHPVIGDYRMAVLWLREGVQVLASDSHNDFFVRNLVALLAEFRAAFGVLAPAAFCEADIS